MYTPRVKVSAGTGEMYLSKRNKFASLGPNRGRRWASCEGERLIVKCTLGKTLGLRIIALSRYYAMYGRMSQSKIPV